MEEDVGRQQVEGDDLGQQQDIHHDELNEFGEEIWTAFGENLDSHNTGQSQVGINSDNNLQIWTEWGGVTQVAIGSMSSDAGPAAAHTIPIIRQESVETYENKEFLTEEVETLNSCASNVEVNETIDDEPTKESKVLLNLSRANLSQRTFISSRTSTRRSVNGEFCRICHEANYIEGYISPCDCRGTLSLVHKSCLERWLAQSDSNHCELCGHLFRMTRIPKYGIVFSLLAWLTGPSSSRDRRKLLLDLLMFIVMCPIVGLANFLALQLADLLNPVEDLKLIENTLKLPEKVNALLSKVGQLCILSAVITMDITFMLWAATRSQHHMRKWYMWYRRNCIVRLNDYPQVNISIKGEPSISSETNIRSIAF